MRRSFLQAPLRGQELLLRADQGDDRLHRLHVLRQLLLQGNRTVIYLQTAEELPRFFLCPENAFLARGFRQISAENLILNFI